MNRRERRRQAKEARETGKGDKAASHGIRGEQLAGEGKIDEAIVAFRHRESRLKNFCSKLLECRCP